MVEKFYPLKELKSKFKEPEFHINLYEVLFETQKRIEEAAKEELRTEYESLMEWLDVINCRMELSLGEMPSIEVAIYSNDDFIESIDLAEALNFPTVEGETDREISALKKLRDVIDKAISDREVKAD